MYLRAVLQSLRGGQHFQPHVGAPRAAKASRRRQNHATTNRGMFHAREIHGRALTRFGSLYALSGGLDAAYPQNLFSRQQVDLFARRHMARNQRARDHGSKSLNREGPVNGYSEIPAGLSPLDFFSRETERLF